MSEWKSTLFYNTEVVLLCLHFKKQKSKKKKGGWNWKIPGGTKNFNLQSIDLPTEASLSKVKVNSAALLYKVSQLVLYEQL